MSGEVRANQHRGLAPELQNRVGSVIEKLSRWLAIAGGIVLVAIVLMTVTSITGRALIFAGLGPVPGDFELVEISTAFAVFAFLPWCQFKRGHVTVDIFISWLSARKRAFLSLVSNLLLLVISTIIFWRLVIGTLDKLAYRETTFILQFPLWWGYAASLIGAGIFVVVTFYTVWRSLNEVLGSGEPAALDAH